MALLRVGTDERALGDLAARHFADHGHRRFAYLRAPGHAYSVDREQGFKQALQSHGYSLEFVWPETGDTAHEDPWRSLYLRTDAAGRWLADLPKPIALLAANDVIAHFASAAAHLAGVGVPEQVAILGADNDIAVCESAHVPLSSIPTPSYRIGWTAVQLIEKAWSGTPLPSGPVLISPSEVVVRQSTDLLAIADHCLARAFRYIQDNADAPIFIGDVARHAGLSRRTMEDRFRKSIRRSPMEEVRRTRMERAKHLLLTTPMSVGRVAESTGYATQEYFCTQFRLATGFTPTQFRQQAAGLSDAAPFPTNDGTRSRRKEPPPSAGRKSPFVTSSAANRRKPGWPWSGRAE
jgi:LacI family transcriptional regulator